MAAPNDELEENLAKLRIGGEQAIELFMDLSRRFYDRGGSRYLETWLGVALPALPELERRSAFLVVMRSLFDEFDEEDGFPEQYITLH